MTDVVLTYRGVVYPWQIDHMGHMNVQHYVGMFDHASWALLGQLGLTASYFRKHNRGMAALEQNLTYKHELHAGDLVEIWSGVFDVKAKTMRMFHHMRNIETGLVAARAVFLGIFMDTDARKSLPIPDFVKQRAGSYASPEPPSISLD
jgi:acyl-CoA thioester hydrolase